MRNPYQSQRASKYNNYGQTGLSSKNNVYSSKKSSVYRENSKSKKGVYN